MAASIRDALAACIAPGMTTADLDEFALKKMHDFGARSAFKGYHGYPGHICVSVNEEVVHGIPGKRRIGLGDVVSVDVGVIFDGFVGDTALTVPVGTQDEEVFRLLDVTKQALVNGIEKAVAGSRVGDISHAVESTAKKAGFTVVREFVGHGIGRDMHEEPQIPNFGSPGRGPKLSDGMTLAIEPMVNLGGAGVEVMEDGWTVKTADRKASAHFEHTVLVQSANAEILTIAENAE